MMEMKCFIFFVIALNLLEVLSSSDDVTTVNVVQRFVDAKVVPDAVNVAPQDEIWITYRGGVSVNFGNMLTTKSVNSVPNVEWDANSNELYTLIMVDPDAPHDIQALRCFRHWVVINISGSDIATGDTITTYRKPTPPPRTGRHRYVFLVYKQANGKIENKGPIQDGRAKWSAVRFANKFSLGNPIAGNFFRAEVRPF